MDYSSDLIRQKSVKGCQERIDAIVYELYGLTDDEIKIVEEDDRRLAREDRSEDPRVLVLQLASDPWHGDRGKKIRREECSFRAAIVWKDH